MPKESTPSSTPGRDGEVKSKNEKLLSKRLKQLGSDDEGAYLEAAQSLERFLVSTL